MLKKLEIDNDDIQKKIWNIYTKTDDPYHCGWLFPNGDMTHLSLGAKGNNVCHFSVTFITNTPTDKEECINEFLEAGAIRHVHSMRAVQIKKKPTEKQIIMLAKLLKTHYDQKSWVYGRTQLHMDHKDKKFFKVFPLGHNPAYIINEIKEFFSE